MSHYLFERPANASATQLHAEIAALKLLPGECIEWLETEVSIRFDAELSDAELARLAAVVEAHDGTAEQLAEATKAARISVILEAAKALSDSAKAKRLAGKPLSDDELAALVDLSLFG